MRTAILLLGCGLAVAAVGCSEKNWPQTLSPDSAPAGLKQTIQSRLSSNPELAQVDVNVDAAEQAVTLSGSVGSESARDQAVELTRAARANVAVVDHIEVNPGTPARSDYTESMARDARRRAQELGNKVGQSIDDAWIYSSVETKLVANAAKPAFKIKVDVDGDVVTLRGEVESASAKQEAERIASQTPGVKRVQNLLVVSQPS